MKNQYPQNTQFSYTCVDTGSWTLMHTQNMCVVFNSYLDTVAWLKSTFLLELLKPDFQHLAILSASLQSLS